MIRLPFLCLTCCCVLFWTSSCHQNNLVNETRTLPEKGWPYDLIPTFEFEVTDTTHLYEVYVLLQINSEEFKYRNVNMVIHMRDPDGVDIQNKVNLFLSDESGRWHGSGSAAFKTFRIPVAEDLHLKKPGWYLIGLEQHSRDTILDAVQYVGIAVDKGEAVF
jgi:gliding motility-associated lipoprotein GldH